LPAGLLLAAAGASVLYRETTLVWLASLVGALVAATATVVRRRVARRRDRRTR
jgi:hypothetical protein